MKSLVLVALCGFFSWGYSVTVETKGLPSARLFSVDVREDTVWALARTNNLFEANSYRNKAMVFKSVDRGKSWSGHEIEEEVPVWKIRFVTDSLGFVMADNRLYRSTDGGESWTRQVFSGAGVPMSFYGKNEDTLFAFFLNGSFLSEDGGETWSPYLEGNGLGEIYFLDDAVGFLSAGGLLGGGVYKTEDGGETYYQVHSQGSESFGSFGQFHFFNSQRGIVMDGKYVYETTDGGENWKAISDDLSETGMSSNVSEVVFMDDQIGFVQGDHVFRTDDGGKTWEQVTFDGEHPFWGLARGSQESEVIVVGDRVLWLDSEGETVDEILLSARLDDIVFRSSEEGWGTYSNRIARTLDGGSTWRLDTLPDAEGSELIQLVRAGDETLFACGSEGALWKLEKESTDWEHVATGLTDDLLGIEFIDDSTGWCFVQVGGDAYDIYVTRDGGVTWAEQSLPETAEALLLNYQYPRLGMSFYDERSGWLRVDDQWWRTRDGGENWMLWTSISLVHPPGETLHFRFLATGSETLFLESTIGWPNSVSFVNVYFDEFGSTKRLNDYVRSWFLFENPCYGYMIGESIALTEDGGRSWTEIDFDLSEIEEMGGGTLLIPSSAGVLSGYGLGRTGTYEWGKFVMVNQNEQVVHIDLEIESKEEVAFYEFGLERPYPLTLSFESEAGVSYIIEKSHDMEHWERDCGTVVADGDRMEWMDATLDDPEALPRFYRVMELVTAE